MTTKLAKPVSRQVRRGLIVIIDEHGIYLRAPKQQKRLAFTWIELLRAKQHGAVQRCNGGPLGLKAEEWEALAEYLGLDLTEFDAPEPQMQWESV